MDGQAEDEDGCKKHKDGRTCGRTKENEGQTGGWTNRQKMKMAERKRRTDKHEDGRKKERTDGRMDGQTKDADD
jgi:hypothetical protein